MVQQRRTGETGEEKPSLSRNLFAKKALPRLTGATLFSSFYIHCMSFTWMRSRLTGLQIPHHHRDLSRLSRHLALKQVHAERPLKLSHLFSHYRRHFHGIFPLASSFKDCAYYIQNNKHPMENIGNVIKMLFFSPIWLIPLW